MKEHSKPPESELIDEEIANLSDGEFKALVIKMLTELIELGQKNERTNQRHPKRNKAIYSANQQCQEGNQDSKQRFGTKRKNKHPTGTE